MGERGSCQNVTYQRGGQLECEKPLHGGGGQKGSFSVTYSLNDPIEN